MSSPLEGFAAWGTIPDEDPLAYLERGYHAGLITVLVPVVAGADGSGDGLLGGVWAGEPIDRYARSERLRTRGLVATFVARRTALDAPAFGVRHRYS